MTLKRHIDNAWNLVDMALGLSAPGTACRLLGEARDELSLALARMEAFGRDAAERLDGEATTAGIAPKSVSQDHP